MSTSSPDPPDVGDRVFDDFLVIRALRRVSILPPLNHDLKMPKKASTPSSNRKPTAEQKELDEQTLEAVSGGAGVNLTGTDQDDTMKGTSAADVLAGGEGNDTLEGGDGGDTLRGNEGDDTLRGQAGDDYLVGGEGNDTLVGGQGKDKLVGGDGNDRMFGGAGSDYLRGGEGDDKLVGGSGNDVLMGGAGDDEVTGGYGHDTFVLTDGDGNDTLNGNDGWDVIWLKGTTVENVAGWSIRGAGGEPQPLGALVEGHIIDLSTLGGAGELISPSGEITTFSNMERIRLDATHTNDTLVGTSEDDVLLGDGGDDNIRANRGNDVVDGGAGNDRIDGGGGHDTLRGGAGDDWLKGNAGNDIIDGGAGDDKILGNWGGDTLRGGDGNDTIAGGEGDYRDTLEGGAGNDVLAGDGGADMVSGGEGDDRFIIRPGEGNDTLVGGPGRDIIWMEGVTSAEAGGWTLKMDDGFETDLKNWSDVKLSNHGGAGQLISPTGDVITFTEMENLSFAQGAADDTLYGQNGDILRGGEGDDQLMGIRGEGNILDGGAGDDTLIGGSGSDDMSGGAGNDHFIVNSLSTNGNDVIRGGGGRDSVLLARTSASEVSDWNYQSPNGTLTPLNQLMIGQTVDLAALGGDGVLVSPSGETITFSEMETLTLELPTVSGGDVAPLEVIPPHVEATPVATIIGGLPKGVYVAGAAEPPQPSGDGSFFQVVDREALTGGDLQLVFGPGILHDLELTVATMTKEGGEIETTSGSFIYQIEPQDADFVSVSHGEMGFDDQDRDGMGSSWVPLDIVINPEIRDGATIDIGGLEQDMLLINAAGERFTPERVDGGWGVPDLTPQQVQGLHVRGNAPYEIEKSAVLREVESYLSQFEDLTQSILGMFGSAFSGTDAVKLTDSAGTTHITVHIEAEFEGESMTFDQGLNVEFPAVEVAQGVGPNGEKITTVMGVIVGDRADYNIVRQGNTISVQPVNGGETQAFSMFDFDAVRFGDGILPFSDFRQAHDISAVFEQLETNGQLEGSTVILVSGIPEGAILDLGANLGNGVWGIPAQAVADRMINLDFPSMAAEAEANIQIRATTLTEEDTVLFNGLLRVSGFASAEARAGTAANARFALDGNGVRAGAGANAEVSAVASAGGTFGPYTVSASASASVSAEASVGVNFSATETEVEAYVGVRAEIKAEGEVDTQMAPGVHSSSTGEVGVAVVAEAGGNGYMQHGKGNYGAGGEGEAAYGSAASAEGYHSQTVGAAQVGGGGGASAGGQVGAGGGGHAGIQGDTIHFGLSGDVALLIGVEFDFDIAIDVGEIADVGKLIADGVLDAAYAIEGGLIDAGDAINAGFIDARDAFAAGLLSVEEEINQGFRDTNKALTAAGREAERAWNNTTDAIGDKWKSATSWTGL